MLKAGMIKEIDGKWRGAIFFCDYLVDHLYRDYWHEYCYVNFKWWIQH